MKQCELEENSRHFHDKLWAWSEVNKLKYNILLVNLYKLVNHTIHNLNITPIDTELCCSQWLFKSLSTIIFCQLSRWGILYMCISVFVYVWMYIMTYLVVNSMLKVSSLFRCACRALNNFPWDLWLVCCVALYLGYCFRRESSVFTPNFHVIDKEPWIVS